MNNKITVVAGAAVMLGSLLVAAPAFAQGPQGQEGWRAEMFAHMHARLSATTSLPALPPRNDSDGDSDMRGGWGRHASTSPMWGQASSTLPQGNGEPVVGGSVTAIGSSTLTITNKAGATYTVDTSDATVHKKGDATSGTSSINVGDNVIVQGAVNGTSVTASSVIDQGDNSRGGGAMGSVGLGIGAFFGGIGNFFHRLFGFF